MKTEPLNPDDFIVPLSINGLNGRAMHIKSAKKTRKREILLLYGHHASLERVFTMAQNLTEFGNVTVPDLPGFGGMDSFYHLGQKPTLDAMADYLATFIKLQYRGKTITICAMSWGFVVATYMLQKYPKIAKQINLYVSMVGFAHKDDFNVTSGKKRQFKFLSMAFKGPIGSTFFRYVLLAPIVIKTVYKVQANTHPKMKGASKEELNRRLNFEVKLWHSNDVRTQMYTGDIMLNLDLTTKKINLPVVHIYTDGDQYFDNKRIIEHFKMIFSDVTEAKAKLPNHAPTIIDDVAQAGAIFPPSVRKMLAKKPT